MKKYLLFPVLLLSLPLMAATTGVQWLSKMADSFDNLSYDGVFIHAEGGVMNSMRVRHGLIGGVEYESLQHLDGAEVEVIRADDSVICVYPDKDNYNNKFIPNEPFKRFRELDNERLQQAYEISVSAENVRIASHDAVQVSLKPKDDYRYAHEFWIERDNGFLLKHDVLSKGKLLERIQFTTVNLNPDLKARDFSPKNGTYVQRFVQIEPQPTTSLWQFDWLPTGFSLVWPEARKMNKHTSILLISDGMASVSVFIEPIEQKRTPSLISLGATVAGERSIQSDKQNYLLTMVGEVPPETINKLMSVIMPKAQHD